MNLVIMDTISLRKVIDATLIWLKLISFRLILYSIILQKQPMFALKTMPFVTSLQDEDPFTLIVNVNVVMLLVEV